MEKVTWRAVIKEGMVKEYIKRHDEIWPEMVETLKAAGICNYTIWLDGNSLFGYYECEKGAEYALDYQAESEVVKRWNVSMDPIMTMFDCKPQKVFELK
jgi:L-rhamnose mutarotase